MKDFKEFKEFATQNAHLDEGVDANKVAKLTDRNNHFEALQEVAKGLRLKKWVKVLDHMIGIRDEMGDAGYVRDLEKQVYKSVMGYAKNRLDKEEYEQIYNAM